MIRRWLDRHRHNTPENVAAVAALTMDIPYALLDVDGNVVASGVFENVTTR